MNIKSAIALYEHLQMLPVDCWAGTLCGVIPRLRKTVLSFPGDLIEAVCSWPRIAVKGYADFRIVLLEESPRIKQKRVEVNAALAELERG